MGTKALSTIIGLALLATGAQSALASTINVTYKSSAYGYSTGYVTPSPNGATKTAHVYIGGETFHNDTGNNYGFVNAYDDFVAWCVDPLHWTKKHYTYNVGGKTELVNNFGTARVNDLQILANNFYGGVGDRKSSAAFQIAVWSILFGSESGGTYSYAPGSTFAATGLNSGVNDLATYYLAHLDPSLAKGHYKATYLFADLNCDASKTCAQNQVSFTPSPVPLPAAMPLMLSGLFGLGFAARRRKSKQA